MEDLQEETASLPVASPASAKIRKTLLFVLLGIMIVAIAYDYRIARPAVASDYDRITNESRLRNATPGQTFSNTDLGKLLGREPSSEFRDGDEFVEVYNYTSGIPGRPHRLFAHFKSIDGAKLFYRHAKFAFESRGYVAPIPDNIVLKYTEADAEAMAKMDAFENARMEKMAMFVNANGNPNAWPMEIPPQEDLAMPVESVTDQPLPSDVDTDRDGIDSADEFKTRTVLKRAGLGQTESENGAEQTNSQQ